MHAGIWCIFYTSVLENNIYALQKVLGNILLLRTNAGKTFTESCNKLVKFSYPFGVSGKQNYNEKLNELFLLCN